MIQPASQLAPPASADVSVLLVEPHALVLAALRALLSAIPGLRVVAHASGLVPAIALARLHRPDVVLVSGRSLDETEGLLALRREVPKACMLVLTDDEPRSDAGTPEAADRCLTRDCGIQELCAMVASVLSVDCGGCELRRLCPSACTSTALTRREREVAVQIAQGLTSKEIGARLGIRPRTVHAYRESLARKLGASSAAVVTRFVIESGLL